MGTGSGLLAILAAKQGTDVVAVDINPYAVQCAKQNAQRNGVGGKVALLQGDLFAPLRETAKFDLILFNSPYLPSEHGEDKTWLALAWAGGATGRQVIDRFIIDAPRYLEKAGKILFMQSNLAGVEETQEKFKTAEMTTEVVASLELPFFETLILLRNRLIKA
jgi:release factor glutamine methyltransferase